MATNYPLSWPDGWPRSKAPGASQFRTELRAALKNVTGSLDAFGRDSGQAVGDIIVSSNYTLTDERPRDGGVAVYFLWKGHRVCLAVDRYAKLADNLQAIHHCLEAERTKLRHGGIAIVEAAFRGYAALPPPTRKPWREVLGYPDGQVPTLEDVKARQRRLAQTRHPDKGGSQDEMAELNNARADAEKELGQ